MELSNSSSENQTNGNNNNNKSSNRGYRCCDDAVKVPFQIVTITLLSLLLPLSFLLLARLSTAQYLVSVADNYPTPDPTSFLCSLFLNSKRPTILHLLVSIVSVSALTYALTGRIAFIPNNSPKSLKRCRLYAAWIFLFVLQLCVGLGIEGSIAAGIDGSGFGQENSFLFRVPFFLGLHETMTFWGRSVVKPVVDDTIFGGWREERWAERVAIGVSYGWLWWWRLREEVEALVVVPEVKRALLIGVGVADFMGWWLYFLTVTIGMVRVVKGLIFAVVILTRRREGGGRRFSNDEKV